MQSNTPVTGAIPDANSSRPQADELVRITARQEKYLFNEMFRVGGATHTLDGYCFATLLRYQTANGLVGGAAEIGIDDGRSFFLIAASLRPQERAFAADLFVKGAVINGENKQLTDFRAKSKELGLEISPQCMAVGPSEDVTPEQILTAVGAVRFFSVDGGHMIEHINADAPLANNVIAPHGIIAFDDYGNPEWPEVAAGVNDFLRDHKSELVAFAITRGKLYVCRPEFHDRYVRVLEDADLLSPVQKRRLRFLDTEIVWLHQSFSSRVVDYALHKLGLGRLAHYRNTALNRGKSGGPAQIEGMQST